MRAFVAAAALTLAVGAGGCSILREPPAEQLYRIGSPSPAPLAANQREAPTVRIGLDPGGFPREAAGIRILSAEGSRVSYLAGARWAAPASTMFEEALIRAFSAQPDAVLYSRGAGGSAQSLLRVDVTEFEADYDQGPAAPPMVRVRASARLVVRQDRAVQGQRDFYAERRAADNRVSAVVDAYDAAVGQLTQEIAAWGAERARRTPAS